MESHAGNSYVFVTKLLGKGKNAILVRASEVPTADDLGITRVTCWVPEGASSVVVPTLASMYFQCLLHELPDAVDPGPLRVKVLRSSRDYTELKFQVIVEGTVLECSIACDRVTTKAARPKTSQRLRCKRRLDWFVRRRVRD